MRVPPSLHNSARTPMFFEFTRPINACGNVFSRPTRSPTTFWSATVVLLLLKELQRHQLPPGPVMPRPAPNVQVIGHRFGPQLGGELARRTHADVLAPCRQYDLLLPHPRKVPIVVQVRQVVYGRIEIYLGIIVRVDKALQRIS